MNASVFVELKFWVLVGLSLLSPAMIYGYLIRKQAIVRSTVALLGVCLVSIAAFDVYLLQSLAVAARHSLSSLDDAVFASEVSIALYALPICFGGIGVNLISHVLISHLSKAERKFAQSQAHRLPLTSAASRLAEVTEPPPGKSAVIA
jgi:hypothetical protein